MPSSCVRDSARVAAKRLSPACLSTHRDACWRQSPDCGGHPPYGWELGKSGFNGQKRSKINAIAMVRLGRDMAGQGLVNGGALRLIHHFDRLFALPRPPELGDCPPRSSSPLLQQKDFHDHLVPGNQNRPALPPRHRPGGLPCAGAARRSRPRRPTIRCWRRSTARKSSRATSPWPKRNSGRASPRWTRRPRTRTSCPS